MACMEWLCRTEGCDEMAFNNKPRFEEECPKCKGTSWIGTFDEPPEDHE